MTAKKNPPNPHESGTRSFYYWKYMVEPLTTDSDADLVVLLHKIGIYDTSHNALKCYRQRAKTILGAVRLAKQPENRGRRKKAA